MIFSCFQSLCFVCRSVAQLVEYQSPKLGVVGSSPIAPVRKIFMFVFGIFRGRFD